MDKKNHSKKPFVIIWDKRQIPLYNMLLSKKIKCGFIPMPLWNKDCPLTEQHVSIGNRRIFATPRFIAKEIKKARQKNINTNFHSYIIGLIARQFSRYNTPKIKEIDLNNAKKLIEKLKLNNKFIVLMPEASSLTELSYYFWKILSVKLLNEGYQIFVNTRNGISSLPNAKSARLNIMELYTLASLSDGVIGLSSGMAVLMTTLGVKMDHIYTDFREKNLNIDAKLAREMYSVLMLPWSNARIIREHDFSQFNSEEKLLNKIVSNYLIGDKKK